MGTGDMERLICSISAIVDGTGFDRVPRESIGRKY